MTLRYSGVPLYQQIQYYSAVRVTLQCTSFHPLESGNTPDHYILLLTETGDNCQSDGPLGSKTDFKEQKKHVSSSASRNLKSSFLVTRILCKNLNENCIYFNGKYMYWSFLRIPYNLQQKTETREKYRQNNYFSWI